jgi:O-antigen/teichoic acid export membrane protein
MSAGETTPFKMSRVGRHAIVYALGVLLGKALSFVMLPFYTRYLTPADYGVMQLVEMTLDIVAIFAGTQIASGVFRYYHKAESAAERQAVLSTASVGMIVSYVVFSVVTGLAASGISRLVFGSPDQAVLIRLAAASLAVQSLIIVPSALLRLEERSVEYTLVVTVKLVLQMVLNIVFLAVFHLGVRGVFVSTLIANLAIGVWLFVPFVARMGVGFSRERARDLLFFGLPLVGTHIATFIATFGDRYFLRVSGDVTAVGLYSLAYQFGFILSYLGYWPFSLIWEPVRFEVARRADRDDVFARAFVYMNLLLLTMALGIALSVGDFIRVMSPVAYHRASDLVPVILIAYILQSWSLFQEAGILVRERTGYSTLANWLAALTALAGYALLVPRWLGLGAALATVLAFAVRQIATYVASQRLWPIRYRWGHVWQLVALVTAAYGVSLLFPPDPLWRSIALRIGLFGLYLVALWYSGMISVEDRSSVRARLAVLTGRRVRSG